MLLSSAFFPPVSWFAAAAEDWGRIAVTSPSSVCDVYVEACESYCKQSYRNRCIIATAAGPEAISYPVVHEGDLFHTPITQVKVDYSVPWVLKACRAMDSAYKSSAFYEFYRDDIFAILESGLPTLWELNKALADHIIAKTRLGIRLVPTSEFIAPGASENPYGKDYRSLIHPKKQNGILEKLQLEKPYFQVFAGKYGFLKDLSVVDLLFNEGPDSFLWLVRTSSQR